jgi:hypothetical protein
MTKKASKGLRYVGGDDLRLAPDIPRHDLTPEEVEKFGKRWLLSLSYQGKPLFAEEAVKQKKSEVEESKDA